MINLIIPKEIASTIYLFENKDGHSIILKEFKNFEESLKNWNEAEGELVKISEENRDRFFSIRGWVKQEDGPIKLQTESYRVTNKSFVKIF